MEKTRSALEGFILGDWLGTAHRGKGKGTFKPVRLKCYLKGNKCSGNTSMLLCALDCRRNLEAYRQNLKAWYYQKKYTGGSFEYDMDPVTQKAILTNFSRCVALDAHSGSRGLTVCSVLSLTDMLHDEIMVFMKSTHNSRYALPYACFFVEFVRNLRRQADKELALAESERRCEIHINRQNLSNGNFIVDTVESAVNWFMAGESYTGCVFPAVNGGKASDIVGALTGFLAGMHYGINLKNRMSDFDAVSPYIDAFIEEQKTSVS